MVVLDGDLGDNARYALSLRDVSNSEGLFSVHPTSGHGRTPIVVRVVSKQGLDYDVDDPALRRIEFDVVVHAKGDTVGWRALTEYISFSPYSVDFILISLCCRATRRSLEARGWP